MTLFHKLPREREGEVRAVLERAAKAANAFAIAVSGLIPLGRGVAYALSAPELTLLRSGLAQDFADMLTAQDTQGFRPHITVQNKVAPETARALLQKLRAGFVPWSGRGLGLELWEYRGGPWGALDWFAFGEAETAKEESGAAAAAGADAASYGAGN